MTKVLIYKAYNEKCKRYAVVAPNGVKPLGTTKCTALQLAKLKAENQMQYAGSWTEAEFRKVVDGVVGSFMVKHAE